MSEKSHKLFQEQTASRGKRERTRSALLDSAISVFAEKGFDATRITDITNHAGLANGTFYNYYPDKGELLRDVASGLAVEIARQINDEMTDTDDAVARIVTGTSRVMETARQEPEWIDVLLDNLAGVPELQSAAVQYLRKDLELGVEQQVFHVSVDLLLVNQILALIQAAILFDRQVKDSTITRTCEAILRLLGLPAGRAASQVVRTRKHRNRQQEN